LRFSASGILGFIPLWSCSGCDPWKSHLARMGWKAGNEGKVKMLELSSGAVSVPPLQNISLFKFPHGSPFESLAGSRLPVRMCRKGTLICTQGDVVNCLYIVQKGTVLLSRLSAHGHETIIEFIRPGDFFGEVPMLTGNIARFNATALQPTVLLIVRSVNSIPCWRTRKRARR